MSESLSAGSGDVVRELRAIEMIDGRRSAAKGGGCLAILRACGTAGETTRGLCAPLSRHLPAKGKRSATSSL